MLNSETIKKIKAFGLNTYEVKIWAALLSRGVSTAGELSDIANVPRSRSYDVLESLEKKGFVVMKLGKPIKYLAVPPKEVLERVKKKIKKQTEKHISKIRSPGFNNLIGTLQKTYDNSKRRTSSITAIIKGMKNINEHLEYLFKNSKNKILFSIENNHKEYLQLLNKIKNIDITVLSGGSISQNSNFNVKTSDTKMRLCIVDEDESVIFPVSEDDVHPDYDLCVWIKNAPTAKFLRQLLS
jgi:HTH-type transcriptional regulator, sugar sensing transcriptional regulator